MHPARIASLSGWITLGGILAFDVIGPSLIAGPPPAGATDRRVIEEYYRHDLLLPFAVVSFLTIVTFLVFVTAVRDALATASHARLWASVAHAASVVAAALLLVRAGLTIALVRGSAADVDILPMFFGWDAIYNGALYSMEATYAVAFAAALAAWTGMPRWLLAFGAVVGGLQLLNATSPATHLPFAAQLLGNLGLVAWFAVVSRLIGRLSEGDIPERS